MWAEQNFRFGGRIVRASSDNAAISTTTPILLPHFHTTSEESPERTTHPRSLRKVNNIFPQYLQEIGSRRPKSMDAQVTYIKWHRMMRSALHTCGQLTLWIPRSQIRRANSTQCIPNILALGTSLLTTVPYPESGRPFSEELPEKMQAR